ncbi:hypothetical protein M9Y10_004173 [Tritrichomonas musculus]|uniref:Serine-threonine/tyrosine-protein kinase catalytic domain-containing protein n=1 Tax=Tritrichomonas musculus TaxID=1915356 RepID=A0ABR2JRA7_9EUKA
MQGNKLIALTIHPIIAYLIRRYYYPSYYFEYASFFSYNSQIQNQIINPIDLFSHSNEEMIEKTEKIISNENSEINYENFSKDEFIILRSIKSNYLSKIDLVMHLKTLYLFVMKRSRLDMNREVNCCTNDKNRNLIKFYGLVKKNEKVIGIIYEFMSNSSLSTFLSNKVHYLFSFIMKQLKWQPITAT